MTSNYTNTIQTGTKRAADNQSNNNTNNTQNNRTQSNETNSLIRTNTDQPGTSSSSNRNNNTNNTNNNTSIPRNRQAPNNSHSDVRREPRSSHRSTANRSTTGYEISARGYSNFAERVAIDLTFTAYERIGSGTFGMIHRIQLDGKDLALKIVHQDPEYCNRELYLLEELRGHENVIHLIYSYYTRFEQRIYLNLITELLDTTLFDKIYNNNDYEERLHRSSRYNSQPIMALSMFSLQRCFRDIFKGLEFMHGKKIAHRDLKPENIGFGRNGDVKIIDMGSAKYLDGSTRHSYEICTLLYRAPELLLCNQDYDCSMDIWSVACMLGETITSSPLFFEHQSFTLLRQIIQYLGQPPEDLLRSVRGGAFNVVNEQALPKNEGDVKRHLKENVVKLREKDDIVNDIVDILYQCLLYTNRISAENVLKMNFFTRTDFVADDNSQPPDDSSSPPKMSRVKTRRQTAAEAKDGNN